MPTLNVHDVPDELYRGLASRATAHGRSLNSEVLACLQRAASDPAVDAASTLGLIGAPRERLQPLPPLTDQVFRAAKEFGRS